MVSKVSIGRRKKEIKKRSNQTQTHSSKKKVLLKTKEKKKSYNKRFEKIKEIVQKEKGMNSYFIMKRLERVENFCGVYSIDNLPVLQNYPAYLVVNLSPENSQGSHWIALRVEHSKIEVFDSLKLKKYPKELTDFFGDRKKYFYKRIQSDSSFYCGFFVCFFVIFRSLYSLKTTTSFFSKTLAENDQLLLNKLSQIW